VWLGAVSVLVLAAVHLAVPLLRRLDAVPRSRWLSFAGGVAVAYVFVHLLPDLAAAGDALAEGAPAGWLERHAYLLALGGFVAFYALEAAALQSRSRAGGPRRDAEAGGTVLALHVGSFGAYNALVGYLLAGWDGERGSELLFAVAVAVHLVVVDHGLRDHHRRRYDAVVRWVLAGAVAAGFAAGWALGVRDGVSHLALALLAGAVILNTMTQELPQERRSRLGPFVAGAVLYAAVLLAV